VERTKGDNTMLNKKLLENGVVNAVTIDELDAQFGGMSKRDCNLMKACCAGQAVTYAIHSLLNRLGGDSSDPAGCNDIVRKYCK